MFKIGDKVEWSSQAAGSKKTKQGEILLVVPAGVEPGKVFNDHFGYFAIHSYKIMYYGWPRGDESYLVEVPAKGKGKPFLYRPLVKNLRKMEASAND